MLVDEPKAIDQAKLEAFVGRVLDDLGGMLSTAMALIGDKLGLYKAMADAGPLTSAELAERSGTAERYVRDWLVNQAAGGYVTYDPATGRYTLPPEQALALTDENSPFFVAGGFQVITGIFRAEPRIAEAFRSGGGLCWGDQDAELFEGTERFFRPGYVGNLVSSWIPALEGVGAKLEAGASVADVGCGHGASTLILAQAYPRSRFYGFDNHAPSIERARDEAAKAGLADRVTFQVADAASFPGEGYALVAFFDCLHDMGDPVAAARRARETLAPDGTLLVVEPMAGERVEDNLNPLGRVLSAASALCCTANALATGPVALGSMATEQQLREVMEAAGFTRFRRAAETPFNRVFEARP